MQKDNKEQALVEALELGVQVATQPMQLAQEQLEVTRQLRITKLNRIGQV